MAESFATTNGHPHGGLRIGESGIAAEAVPVKPQSPPRPVVLYLVHRVPYPADKGDRIRNFNVLRRVARHADVHLATLADEPVTAETRAALAAYCTRLDVVPMGGWSRWLRGATSLVCGRTVTEGVFHFPAFARRISELARTTPYHAVLTSSSSMAPYLELPELRELPAVVDLVDVDSEKWFDYARTARGWKAWLYRTEGWRLRRLEERLPPRVRAVTLVSEAEATLYRRFCLRGAVHAITNGVDLDYFQPTARPDEAGCVFVGALDYHPNVEGTTWFCREVWPTVRRRWPDLTLEIVGRRPGAAMRRLAEIPGVTVVGQVPDIRPHVAKAAVAIVPVRIARGVQNKVLEALAMSKAVLATPQAIAGLKAVPGTHLLAASTAAEWTDSLARLFQDAELRGRLGAAGRLYVEEHHRWEHCLQPFDKLLGLPHNPSALRDQ